MKELNSIGVAWFDKWGKRPFAVLSFILFVLLVLGLKTYRDDYQNWQLQLDALNKENIKCRKEAADKEAKMTENAIRIYSEFLKTQEEIFKKSMTINKNINTIKMRDND